MNWIVDAESIDDLVLGNYSVQDMPLTECKDCKNWDTTWQTIEGQHYCPMVDKQTNGEWFCADGERKEK